MVCEIKAGGYVLIENKSQFPRLTKWSRCQQECTRQRQRLFVAVNSHWVVNTPPTFCNQPNSVTITDVRVPFLFPMNKQEIVELQVAWRRETVGEYISIKHFAGHLQNSGHNILSQVHPLLGCRPYSAISCWVIDITIHRTCSCPQNVC